MAVLNPTTSTTTATIAAPSLPHPAVPAPWSPPAIGELPRIEDPSAVSPTDARALSKTLFARLAVLEEG
ncbi:RNA polymerase sigma factor SigF, partial [Kitasatospora sp. NPDC094015]